MRATIFTVMQIICLSMNINANKISCQKEPCFNTRMEAQNITPIAISIKEPISNCYQCYKSIRLQVIRNHGVSGAVNCSWLKVIVDVEGNNMDNISDAKDFPKVNNISIMEEPKNVIILGNLLPMKTYRAKIRCYTNDAFEDSSFITFHTSGPVYHFEIVSLFFAFCQIIFLLVVFFVLPKAVSRYCLKPNFTFKGKQLSIAKGSYPFHPENIINELSSLVRNFSELTRQFYELNKLSPVYDCNYSRSNYQIEAKNRYTDIFPFDYTRVVLKELPGDTTSNYINASYIESFCTNIEFIACQGPMQTTAGDFWRMVWERNVNFIVMLTECIEHGEDKCFRYWSQVGNPEGKSLTKENFHIETLSCELLNGYFFREICITKGKIKKTIFHWQYIQWQDMDCPQDLQHLLSFVYGVRNSIQQCNKDSHLVAHCSAGIGRTGTFLEVLNLLIVLASKPSIKCIDIFMDLLLMRHFRAHMVQTASQYRMIHKLLLLHLAIEGHADGKIESKTLRKIQKMMQTTQSLIEFNTDSEEETSFIIS